MRLQSLLKWTIGLSVASLILVACGGDAPSEADTQVENQNGEPTPDVSFLATDAPTVAPTATETPALPPPTDVPFDVQFSDLSAGEYSFSMVGVLNSDIGFTPFDSGMTGTDYELAPNGTTADGPYEVALWTDILTDGTTDDTTARIVFTVPVSAQSGTFDVVGRDEMLSPEDIGVEIVTGFGSQRFGSTANGTLNIIANSGESGVFTGEFEVSIGDDAGNTILATGRASAIPFVPEESAELTMSGAVNAQPSLDELIYSLGANSNTASNNDWVLSVATINTDTNPYIIQHQVFMRPDISAGTYDIVPRVSELDARPDDLPATAFVELFNPTDGTQIIATSVSGTLEVLPIRDRFSATFTMTYAIGESDDGSAETVSVTAGAYHLFKPAR